MQLFEAVVLSFINTLIITGIFVIRIVRGRKTRLYGPVLYNLDKSGALREAHPDSVPLEEVKAIQERILREIKPTIPRLKKTTVVLFAAIILITQLIIFLSV
ncbi:MAG: hypothetical protein ACQXXG_02985 [Candidatus Bathyarchaeia archaeon]|nr:hypothetical protein [Candidatus Bathyarchaeota archaeon A05DMB-3]